MKRKYVNITLLFAMTLLSVMGFNAALFTDTINGVLSFKSRQITEDGIYLNWHIKRWKFTFLISLLLKYDIKLVIIN